MSITHLQWPFELAGDGTFATVEQDTLEDVQQCIRVLVQTPLGARPLAPEIGVDDPTFAGVNGDDLQVTLEEQEPRATVDVTVAAPDKHGEQTVELRVEVA